ncbi:MAG: HlyD family efflux transporter periplasmic adaptor subunit [Pirellulales bacterium]
MAISNLYDRRQCGRARAARGSAARGLGLVGMLAAVAVLGTAAAGATWWFTIGRSPDRRAEVLLDNARRNDFLLSITERGEVESAGDTLVKSEVKSKNTTGLAILNIIAEGTVVKQGDFLAELDSSALQEERITQEIFKNNAEALVVEAQNLHETAIITHAEYLDGTFIQERQTIESEAFVAEETLSRAKEYYEYSKKLAAKGYVNQLQLEADQFAVEQAKKALDVAQTKLKVLENYTKPKMVKTLESTVRITKAKWEAAQNSFDLENQKLKGIEEQIAKCTIAAPIEGYVKYAHDDEDSRDGGFIVQEGALVRERQTIIRIPDPESMRVELNINESMITHVQPGMPAAINPIGLGDLVVKGTVERVNQYAEPSGWRRANVKEYEAYVKIDDPASQLRSGMTASVTIRSQFVPDALQVPVQAVYAHGDEHYCFVMEGGKLQARPVKTGPTNDRFFVIEEGLTEADRIALNPRSFVDQVDLPALKREDKQRTVTVGVELPEQPVASDKPAAATNSSEAGAG